jgi:hypothetical protein
MTFQYKMLRIKKSNAGNSRDRGLIRRGGASAVKAAVKEWIDAKTEASAKREAINTNLQSLLIQ